MNSVYINDYKQQLLAAQSTTMIISARNSAVIYCCKH